MLARKDVAWSAHLRNGDGRSFQVTDRMDLVSPKELEAADVGAGQHHDRIAGFNLEDERAGKVHADIGLAGCHRKSVPFRPRFLRYWSSVKPSPPSRSWATY